MTVRYGFDESDTQSFDACLFVTTFSDGGREVIAEMTITPQQGGGVLAVMPGLGWKAFYSDQSSAIQAAKSKLKEVYG